MKLLHNLTLKNLYEIRYRLLAVAALAIFLGWLVGGNPLITGLVAATVITGGDVWRLSYLDALHKRMTAPDGGPVWDVELNQVNVGTISDAEYAAIQRKCFTEPRLYAAQAMNALRVISRAFDQIALAIPICLFWVIVAVAAFSPGTITTTLAELHKASPDAIQSAVENAVGVLVIVMLTVVPMLWMLGLSRFGFINKFGEATATAIRKKCKTASEGHIALVRQADGGWLIGDDFAHVRPKANGR